MSDRFYGQRDGKLGYRKANVEKPNRPKRRLKAAIVADIALFLGKELPSLSKMTVADLEYLLEYLETR